jgi:DNA-binding transcriptional MerR regulator
MRIGEAARALGVCSDTLRRLERAGTFKISRDWRGARRFSDGDIKKLRRLLFPKAVEVER